MTLRARAVKTTVKQGAPTPEDIPLVVDLDGTLIRSDLLIEAAFAHLGEQPQRAAAILLALSKGKAPLKNYLAQTKTIDVSRLPYDDRVLALVEKAREDGRRVYIASASPERFVAAIADHLGIFDGWFASTSVENLSSHTKASRLVEHFGAGGFDYVGNDAADLPVWAQARLRTALEPSGVIRKRLSAIDPTSTIIYPARTRFRNWLKLLRVHQWAKNALVFVPLVASLHFDFASFATAFFAFLAFSVAASGIYIINDLVDLDSDRGHLTKKNRPLAAGTVPILQAVLVAPFLVLLALFGASLISPVFLAVILVYVLLTTAYTFALKRKMVVDVVTLAILYSIRVIGGAVAISVAVSEWLLAFSLFIFVSMALIKRFTELAGRLDANLPDPTNRNYRKIDLDVIVALAAASGFNAVTVFTLYISSDTVKTLYVYPQVLWLLPPILVYWIARTIMLAHRRWLHDDPIVFALTDRKSQLAFILIVGIIVAASGVWVR